ncbi:hypothetical protein ACJMK2_030486 [Sinanodonta woodiana]|uniref:Ufm1-specific protease 2 n=1 Tax=Sinanodonta woodiana TaxID=1069815 RepID=A0ABD3WVV5_SINWO
MAVNVIIHRGVLNLISESANKITSGFLLGNVTDDKTIIHAVAFCPLEDVQSTVHDLELIQCGGSQICGVVYQSKSEPKESNVKKEVQKLQYLLQEVEAETMVVCHIRKDVSQVTEDNIYLYLPDQSIKKPGVHINEEGPLSDCVIARVRCHIPVTFAWDKENAIWNETLQQEIQTLCNQIQSDSTVFHLATTPVVLTSSSSLGINEAATCSDICDLLEDEFKSKKRKKGQNRGLVAFSFEIYRNCSRPDTSIPSCSPVIKHSQVPFRSVTLSLSVDALAVIDYDTPVLDLHHILASSVCRQLYAMEACLIQHSKGDSFPLPEVFHFNPDGQGTLFTVCFPKGVKEEDLAKERKELHDLLLLPCDRPLFRQGNKYLFPEERNSLGYLINPHVGLPPPKAKDGKVYTVSGLYTYHHYMQDRFDDDKWGCAYRSLQTLVSWFRFQGYTDRPVPTHRDIQQALVDIGDKESNFIGSRRWIGSMEVSYCLDHLIGVTSKILAVNSGAELASRGRELAAHFSTQGTPIMIGGGVLAHTILGVDFNEVTGDIMFLILDPHYTGAEDLKIIQDKGWCGWKGPEFWDKNAHYNLCMPQRPMVI